MSRKEQIYKAAEAYGTYIVDNFHSLGTYKQADFIEGAKWADANPLPTKIQADLALAVEALEIIKHMSSLPEVQNHMFKAYNEAHKALIALKEKK